MLRHALLIRTSAMVVALVASISLSAHAAKSLPAQLGTLQTGGSLTSGSALTYQLNLTVTSPGVLTATATLKGKKLKANFPIPTNSLAVGVATVTSDAITIPTNFQGPAVLRVKARFNGKNIGKKSILITISAPTTMPAAPQTTWYDVGFNTNVLLNANAVSTNGMTAPITYAWTITDTDVRTNATLTGSSTATPMLRTQPITTFTNPVVFSDHVSLGVDLEKLYDLDTNPNLVGFDTEQIGLTTYHLRVVVSDDAAHSATGTVAAICTTVAPAQPTLPLGERQYLTATPNTTNFVTDGVTNQVPVTSAYSWSIVAKPSASTAGLENPKTRTPSLRPDKEGDYVLQLAVGGPVGVTNSSYLTVRGATYVGVATCASCHGTSPQVGLDDRYTPWSQTLHSTMAQRGIDGLLSSHYNESCFACHTLGNDKANNNILTNSMVSSGTISILNGGFDDVQKALGWTFPTVLQVGNYAAMPTNLQNLANIQCESCHGPGSQHPGEESTSLDVAVCATCHQDGHNHFRPSQWALGPHGADDGYLSVSLEEAANPSCSKCHSPAGLVDFLEGKAPIRAIAGRLTCSGCHDPHNMAKFPADAHQLRVYDTVTLDSIDPSTGNNIVLTGQGPSAMCMQCHNARGNPYQLSRGNPNYLSGLPHESTATDILLGFDTVTNVEATVVTSGVTNLVSLGSVTLENSAHAGVAKCVNCHMYQTGSNTVGDHTFSMTDRLTDEDNLAACNQCHAGVDPVTDFDHVSVVVSGRPNGGDYDGDGVVNGVQTEVDGVLAILEDKMTNCVESATATNSLIHTAGYPFWGGVSTNAITKTAQRAAVWNYQMAARELSHGVHNTAYTVRLLQWTYTMLSTNTFDMRTGTVGNPFGGVTGDFPNADLR